MVKGQKVKRLQRPSSAMAASTNKRQFKFRLIMRARLSRKRHEENDQPTSGPRLFLFLLLNVGTAMVILFYVL
jgi:hypothetical protein